MRDDWTPHRKWQSCWRRQVCTQQSPDRWTAGQCNNVLVQACCACMHSRLLPCIEGDIFSAVDFNTTTGYRLAEAMTALAPTASR